MILGVVSSAARVLEAAPTFLTLNGNQYLSYPDTVQIPDGCTMIIDFVLKTKPPVDGGFAHIKTLTYNATQSSPFLNVAPYNTDYKGFGIYRAASPGQLRSLIDWYGIATGVRYKIAVTRSSGTGAVRAYVNGVEKYQDTDLPLYKPTSICGRAGANLSCVDGDFVQFSLFNSALTGAEIAAISADDSYDLSTIPSLIDWWVGGDIVGASVPNRVSGGQPLTLITK